MIGGVEKRIDLRDRHSLVSFPYLEDFVAGSYCTLLEDTEVEPRPSAGCQQCGHPGLIHPDANAIAGYARLSDLEDGIADLIAVPDAHGIVRQSVNREVFPELSVDEVRPIQLLLPMSVGFDLVDIDGTLLTAVPCQVSLTVPLEIQSADTTSAMHRILPDSGVHSATLPLDAARKPDVNRYECCHDLSVERAHHRVLVSTVYA